MSKSKRVPIPPRCHGCVYLHTQGMKDGIHDRWCAQFSKTAPDADPRCRQLDARKERVNP